MFACRRHRLIWAAVAGIHLVALGAVWSGGGRPNAEPAREGGLLLVSLEPDPVAVPGEAKEGVALGAGAPVAVPSPPVAAPVASAATVPTTPAVESSGAIAGVSPPAALGVPAPTAMVFTEPAFLVRQEPVYPERARRAGAVGTAVVRVWLTPAGEVERVELAASSGHRLLDEAALAAAGASTFTPAARDHRPVAASAVATYRFELR